MPPDDPPPHIQAMFDELERAGPFASIEDVNRRLSEVTNAYNVRPQTELGGLSPDEMYQLLHGDWSTIGPLRLNEGLSLDDLAGANMLADARTLLGYVATKGPVKETAARNLPRAAVAALLPLLRTPVQSRYARDIGEPLPKNEGDVPWLMALRHTLTLAELLMRRKGLRVTPRARALLGAERAGELYALLFRTFFRKLNLSWLSRDDRHPQLQPTIAYTFFKLRSAAREWTSPEVLAGTAWLESAKDPPAAWEVGGTDYSHWTLRRRVLEPLAQFGLLEERRLPAAERWMEPVEYRTTELFDRFLRFEFPRGTPRELFLMR